MIIFIFFINFFLHFFAFLCPFLNRSIYSFFIFIRRIKRIILKFEFANKFFRKNEIFASTMKKLILINLISFKMRKVFQNFHYSFHIFSLNEFFFFQFQYSKCYPIYNFPFFIKKYIHYP
jgi:hypothetical protein